jgi:hypothetical protein
VGADSAQLNLCAFANIVHCFVVAVLYRTALHFVARYCYGTGSGLGLYVRRHLTPRIPLDASAHWMHQASDDDCMLVLMMMLLLLMMMMLLLLL